MYDIYSYMYLGYENTLTKSSASTMIPPIPGNSPQINLINECTRGLSELNMDFLGTLMHEDFSNVIHPKSLGVTALNKEACLKHYAELGTGYGVGHTS